MTSRTAGEHPLVAREDVAADGSRIVLLERPGASTTVFGVESLCVGQGVTLDAQALAARPAFDPAADTARRVTQLNVGNTHHCNLACSYCYNELSTQTRKAKGDEGWMSPQVARSMVDALLAQCGDAPSVSLVWIGGEALLQQQLVQQTIAYARARAAELGKAAEAVVYSNGVTLTREVVEWANEQAVSLVVSLDGPPKVHDRDRLFASGRPSGRLVLENVKQFMELSGQPVRRVRAVSVGRKRQLPLHQYLFDLGFNELQVQVAYDEHGTDGRNGVADLDALLDWYETLLLAGVVIAIEPYASVIERLLCRGAAPVNHYPCGAGSTLLGVTPNGSLVPCHHFVRDTAPPVGHVREGVPPPQARAALSIPVAQREPCRGCWARHVCGGECYHRALTAGQGYAGVMTAECDARREIYARTIELFARVSRRRPEVLRELVDRQLTEVAPNPRAWEAEDLSSYE